VGVLAYDWGAPNQQIDIENNIIQGQETAVVVSGPFNGVSIRGNDVYDVNAFVSQTLVGDVPLASKLGHQKAAEYANLTIENNLVEFRKGSNKVPVSLSTYASPPFSGRVGAFTFVRNHLYANETRARWALSAIFGSAAGGGALIAEGNEIFGYSVPFYLRSIKSARIAGNKSDGGRQLLTTDGTVSTLDVRANVAMQSLPRPAIHHRAPPDGSVVSLPGCRC
jgi:hypothetical protein